ncbi:hypothetical protein DFH07DRAFT_787965 [Mycena maculata]|uniref:Uncharacterized protein n=1 Tax=Mycena maculata TaxID=230809 RepID=A0AAD7KDQ4_9AGAR|nr:hypothetical protein DFH07DRAFT_787965 [Mycena maculata]
MVSSQPSFSRPESSPSTSGKGSSPRPCSPPPPAQPQSSINPSRSRPLVELIGSQFPAFDCESAVVFPFQDETARDDAFQKELNEMLLDAALETHAWASARPFHETEMATRKFERQIMAVQEQENEQGMLTTRPLPSFFFLVLLFFEKTRQRLNEFVTRMKSALAALTGMP